MQSFPEIFSHKGFFWPCRISRTNNFILISPKNDFETLSSPSGRQTTSGFTDFYLNNFERFYDLKADKTKKVVCFARKERGWICVLFEMFRSCRILLALHCLVEKKKTLLHTENSSFASLKFQLNCIYVVYIMVFTSSIMWFIIRSSFSLSLRATDYIHLRAFCSFTLAFFLFSEIYDSKRTFNIPLGLRKHSFCPGGG